MRAPSAISLDEHDRRIVEDELSNDGPLGRQRRTLSRRASQARPRSPRLDAAAKHLEEALKAFQSPTPDKIDNDHIRAAYALVTTPWPTADDLERALGHCGAITETARADYEPFMVDLVRKARSELGPLYLGHRDAGDYCTPEPAPVAAQAAE